jgi:hypothetical protein
MPPTVLPFIALAILAVIATVLIAAAIIAGGGAFTTWLFAQLWEQRNRSRVYFFAALNSLFMFLSFLAFTCWMMWEWRPDSSFILQGMFPWACTIAALICVFLHAGMGAIRQLYDHVPLPLIRK